MSFTHFTLSRGVGAITAALMIAGASCTPAQGKILETGIPADVALVGCVIEAALTGGVSVAVIAGACMADAEQVAEILYAAATLPAGAPKAMVTSATAIRSTAAFSDAFYNYPQAANKAKR